MKRKTNGVFLFIAIKMRALVSCALMYVLAATVFHVESKRAEGDDRPNFVFFFPDEMRAESLGTYGHPITQTPNFDRFAGSFADSII